MVASIDAKLHDEIIHHSLTLFRLSAAQVKETLKTIRKLQNKLTAEMASLDLSNGVRKRELEALLKAANGLIQQYYTEIPDGLNVDDVSRAVVKATTKSLTVALGKVALHMPTQDYFKSLASNVLIDGSPAKAWWNKQGSDLSFRFAQQMRQGLANGETNQQLVSRIIGKNGVPGIMQVARRNAQTLVQTSAQAVANDARMATFRANSDVISALQIVATLDGHTCAQCIGYSGARYELDGTPIDNAPELNGGPPWHFNDRCVIIPITKTFEELGLKGVPESKFTTRASDEGQIAISSFDDFLKRKGEDYQNEMLGVGRADMWRDNKITLRDLVDGRGRELSLAELQARFH